MRPQPMGNLRCPVATYRAFAGYVFHAFSQTNLVWAQQNYSDSQIEMGKR